MRSLLALLLGWAAAAGAEATVFIVSNTNDSGAGSLRQAILDANATSGLDEIHFNVPGGGVHTIAPLSPLPPLTDDAGAVLDAYTQPGSNANTLPAGMDAHPRIELSGISTFGFGAALESQSANNVIRGFILGNFGTGILLTGTSSANVVAGNFVGTDRTGTLARMNNLGILVGGADHRIGGTVPADRNLVSGNNGRGVWLLGAQRAIVAGNFVGLQSDGSSPLGNYSAGIELQSTVDCVVGGSTAAARNVVVANGGGVGIIGDYVSGGNAVLGNWFGLSAAGAAAQSNGSGIFLGSLASSNRIGGPAPGEGNTIAGHATGISLGDTGAGNVIRGNRIGTDPTGMLAMPNWTGISFLRSSDTTIGGTSPGEGNIISGNFENAVFVTEFSDRTVIVGNLIGVNAALQPLGNGFNGIVLYSVDNAVGGLDPAAANVIAFNGRTGVLLPNDPFSSPARRNRILGNSIHDNGALGIDLAGDGPTSNDSLDPDSGDNELQNYPVLEPISFAVGGTSIRGILNSVPNATFRVEFFSSPRCDPSGYGEGEVLIGTQAVTTDTGGTGTFAVTVPVTLSSTHRVAATATDSAGNTSEFSACSPIATSFYTVTPCRVVDTRDPAGTWGGPSLQSNTDRTFPIAGRCQIPMTAQAVSFNATVTQPGEKGYLTMFPAQSLLPLASTINYGLGQTRANNLIGALGANGAVTVRCVQSAGTVHLILDVDGYFE